MANSKRLKKHSFELKKAQKKANSLEAELKKTKENLPAVEKARDANSDVPAMSFIEVDATLGKMDKAL